MLLTHHDPPVDITVVPADGIVNTIVYLYAELYRWLPAVYLWWTRRLMMVL